MPFATGGTSRIRTNIPAENAYNALDVSARNISLRQLRLSTGKRINSAADDVAGYITARALTAHNGTLKSALNLVGDALNLANIIQDALDNVNTLVTSIKDAAASASSGAQGIDEKVALAKAAYRLAEQIQTVVDSTVFGGQQLLGGSFSVSFLVGLKANHNLITVDIDMTENNPDFNIESNYFNVNSMQVTSFAGVTNLDLTLLDKVSATDLGIFSSTQIHLTLSSLSAALNNVNKVASFVGGIVRRMTSQEELLKSQITNYNAAISRLEDADVAQEQLELIKAQFLQQASLISLSQSNQNPNAYLQLIRG